MTASPDSHDLYRCLELVMLEAERDPRLRAEIERARREFFGGDPAPYLGDVETGRAAHARFTEWYLLERESEVLGTLPLLPICADAPELATLVDMLQASRPGVFVVQSVEGECAERTAMLYDLQDASAVELRAPDWLPVRAGDVLVGRLFPDESGTALPSVAMAVEPAGLRLARALAQDLERLRPQRRLSQLDLEHLLFRNFADAARRAHPEQPLERLEARLQSFLNAAGKPEISSTEISNALKHAERPGQVMGPLLDQIAFDTTADLDQLRRILLDVWNAHRRSLVERGSEGRSGSTQGAARPQTDRPPRARTLGQELAGRIEQGLERAENVEELFDEIEETLRESASTSSPREGEGSRERDEGAGAGADEDEDEDGKLDLGALGGDLHPLVREFLWETGEQGADARILDRLVARQLDLPVPKLDLEYLDAGDLLRLLLEVYLAGKPVRRAADTRAAFSTLKRFYEWAERTQSYRLGEVLDQCRRRFVEHLERVHALSLALSDTAAPPASPRSPGLLRVVETGAEGVLVLGQGGGEPVPLCHDADLSTFVVGDLILGDVERRRDEARLRGMVVVMPQGVEDLLGA